MCQHPQTINVVEICLHKASNTINTKISANIIIIQLAFDLVIVINYNNSSTALEWFIYIILQHFALLLHFVHFVQ